MSLDLTDEERRWLNGLKEFDSGNRLGFLAVLVGFGQPASYLDIGCGTGAMVNAARQLGIDAYGIDILPHAEPYLYKQDLNTFCDLGRKFALVTSIEVAEHIKETGIMCDTLARHVELGGMLVLTAAPPGQDGDGHISLYPKRFWKFELEARGLHFDEIATQRLFTLWHNTHWATHWCEDNLQVFRR